MPYIKSEKLSVIQVKDLEPIILTSEDGLPGSLKRTERCSFLSMSQAAHLAKNSTRAINNMCYRKGLDVVFPFPVTLEVMGEKCIVNNSKWRKYVLKARKRSNDKQ